jgi:hypothetical protein
MVTHIDVLLGDYESVVRYNSKAIQADQRAMVYATNTSGVTSFYFAYIAHNFHMLVYGAILGGFEKKGMEYAILLNTFLNEEFFARHPELATHLESYSAEDIHGKQNVGTRIKHLLEHVFRTSPMYWLFSHENRACFPLKIYNFIFEKKKY